MRRGVRIFCLADGPAAHVGVLGAAALVLAADVLAPRIVKPTAYNNEISAQLLGLREYIEQDAAAGGKLTPEQAGRCCPTPMCSA